MNNQLIWITGLSGSGKSTVAKELVYILKENDRNVIFLDGDSLRSIFSGSTKKGEKYDRQSRIDLALTYSKLCQAITSQGFTVVIATISLFKEVHIWNRKNQTEYFEVYLKVPMKELARRDPKGIYKGYSEGKIKNVAGLDLQIDEPRNPHYQVDFNPILTPKEVATNISKFLI